MASIIMPQMGETITEGTIVRWIKHEGDAVEKDEPVVEISTDKVDTEVPSPASGTLKKISAKEGETVSVGTELAIVDEAAGPPPPVEEAPKPEEAKAPPTPAPAGFISPVVAKLAREKGVDLSRVRGTGAGGRITKKDVLAAAEKEAERIAPPPPAAPKPPEAVPEAKPREEIVPLTMIRKAIAQKMLESTQSTAHATAIVEIDMENISAQRDQYKEEFKRREGFPLTYLPFVARAAIEALREFPRFNSELSGDNLIIKRYINLAVSVDRPDGLVAPVIRDADALNLVGLARAINDAAKRARSGQLAHDETVGGTFTITNPGSIGSIIQTPIINPPQVAILSLEKIEKRAVPIEGGIGVRKMVFVPLTYDHRVVDGADAARFLLRVKESLETWSFASELVEYGAQATRAA